MNQYKIDVKERNWFVYWFYLCFRVVKIKIKIKIKGNNNNNNKTISLSEFIFYLLPMLGD